MTHGGAAAAPHGSGPAPRLPVPPGGCDAHLHVLDARFPPQAGTPPGAALEDYRAVQRRLGTTRAVVVQAKRYGTDHRCLLDALARLGPSGRGIAVAGADVPDAELRRLHEGGVRGLRFSLWRPAEAVVGAEAIEPLAARVAPLGWHLQLHLSADQIVELAAPLGRLPCPVVFDHMGRLPPARGAAHPAFGVVARLLERERAWVKLSGAYLNTEQGPPGYPDAARIARAFVRLAPERLVWGSDWPHVTEAHGPDDAALLDLLADWAGEDATRARILADNPARLYGFG